MAILTSKHIFDEMADTWEFYTKNTFNKKRALIQKLFSRFYTIKILILTYYFKPDFCAGSFRMEAFVKSIKRNPMIKKPSYALLYLKDMDI